VILICLVLQWDGVLPKFLTLKFLGEGQRSTTVCTVAMYSDPQQNMYEKLLWAGSKQTSQWCVALLQPALLFGPDRPTVTVSDHVRMLVVTFSLDLHLEKHVSKLLGQLRRIRKSLEGESASTLVYRAFVISHVNYCNTLCAGAGTAGSPIRSPTNCNKCSMPPPCRQWYAEIRPRSVGNITRRTPLARRTREDHLKLTVIVYRSLQRQVPRITILLQPLTSLPGFVSVLRTNNFYF